MTASGQKLTVGRPVILGALDEGEVRRVVDARLGELIACPSRASTELGRLDGMVEGQLYIRPDGHVAQARIASSTLGAPAVERCLLDTLQSVKFQGHRSAGLVIVTVPFLFGEPGEALAAMAQEEAAPQAPQAPAEASTPATTETPAAVEGEKPQRGFLPKQAIRDGVVKHIAATRLCFDREFNKDYSLKGRVVLQFAIGLDGTVSRNQIVSSTLNNATVEQCIVEESKGWVFPEPNGGIVVVNYPFSFNEDE